MTSSYVTALQTILDRPYHLPKSVLENAKPKIMAALWGLEVERIQALHPGVAEAACSAVAAIQEHYDQGGTEEDCPDLSPACTEYMNAATEARSWKENGCPWHEFVFPAFFGKKLQVYTIGADGIARPAEED